MPDIDFNTLLLAIPALPLVGAVVTVLLGRLPGRHAHWPAVISIAAAAVAAVALLVELPRTFGPTREHDGESDVENSYSFHVPLWRWATVADAYEPATGTPAARVGDDLAARAAGRAESLPLAIDVGLRVDPLTSVMLTLITCVGLLVAIYSIGYMHGDPGYPRFFALVAAFVFSMSMLVAADNFLLVYVFWEAVGACSYLLIGFWFTKPSAAAAAKKAFLVNRVGDFGLAVAVFLLWMTYGTLNFSDPVLVGGPPVPGILGQTRLADPAGYVGGIVGTAICLLLLLAACGKSAQFPLHVWLPDAMEGPTPASALIHAATMVTAGIYLIARCAPLFIGCPGALTAVSIVGATTALIAALIATVQNDLKRVLAYSTISQLGYMFASLGTGTMLGFTAAIFHLVTHAFFKALLFLGAGSVMHSMGGVIDMRRFGGLRRLMPVTAATFLVGSLALAGVAPFAGFFSKDEILATLHAKAWPDAHGTHGDEHHDGGPAGGHAAHHPLSLRERGRAEGASPVRLTSVTPSPVELAAGHPLPDATQLDSLDAPRTWRILFWMSLVTAGLTAFYTFRAVFMTFTGPTRVPEEAGHHAHESPLVMTVPLMILAVASAVAGWWLFSTHALADFLAATPTFDTKAIDATVVPHAFHWDLAIQGSLAAVVGIVIAALGHLGRRSDGPQMERFLGPLGTLFANRFYIDQIETALVVRPLQLLAAVAAAFDRHVIDGLVDLVGRIPLALGALVRRSQSGLLQRYAVGGALGAILLVAALWWRLIS
ncbi:MAG: NADH-quinone oxidoreductase subunit L [Planctomycetaceae bacterium]